MQNYGDFVALVKEVYPVVSMIAYGNGNYEVIREAKAKLKQQKPLRGTIKMCSKKSLKRLMFLMQVTDVKFSSMYTATYPAVYPADGALVKADVNALANKFRRRGFKYIWFLEFQKRGAPHVHWLLDTDGISPKTRVELGLYWSSRIAQSDWFVIKFATPQEHYKAVIDLVKFNIHEKVWQLLKSPESAKRYVMKYASKEFQKEVPKQFKGVGRFWGSTRGLKPDGIEFDVTEDEVEKWLIKNQHPTIEKTLVPRHVWQVGTLKTTQNALPIIKETPQSL